MATMALVISVKTVRANYIGFLICLYSCYCVVQIYKFVLPQEIIICINLIIPLFAHDWVFSVKYGYSSVKIFVVYSKHFIHVWHWKNNETKQLNMQTIEKYIWSSLIFFFYSSIFCIDKWFSLLSDAYSWFSNSNANI